MSPHHQKPLYPTTTPTAPAPIRGEEQQQQRGRGHSTEGEAGGNNTTDTVAQSSASRHRRSISSDKNKGITKSASSDNTSDNIHANRAAKSETTTVTKKSDNNYSGDNKVLLEHNDCATFIVKPDLSNNDQLDLVNKSFTNNKSAVSSAGNGSNVVVSAPKLR